MGAAVMSDLRKLLRIRPAVVPAEAFHLLAILVSDPRLEEQRHDFEQRQLCLSGAVRAQTLPQQVNGIMLREPGAARQPVEELFRQLGVFGAEKVIAAGHYPWRGEAAAQTGGASGDIRNPVIYADPLVDLRFEIGRAHV